MRKNVKPEDRGFLTGYWGKPIHGSLAWSEPVPLKTRYLVIPPGVGIASYPVASRGKALSDFADLERIRIKAEHHHDPSFLGAALHHANQFGPLVGWHPEQETAALWWEQCRLIGDLYRLVISLGRLDLLGQQGDDGRDHSDLASRLSRVPGQGWVLQYGGSEFSPAFTLEGDASVGGQARKGLELAVAQRLNSEPAGGVAIDVVKNRDIRYSPVTRLGALYLLLLVELIGIDGQVKVCEHCHTEYMAKRSDQRFCTDSCRAKAFYKQKAKEIHSD